MSIETSLGGNSSWELKDKKYLSSVFAVVLPSVIRHIRGVKHSNYFFFSKGSIIAMVFTNAWCEMVRSPKYKHIDVWYSFLSSASLIKNVICTTVVATSASMGLPSKFSGN